MPTPLLVITSDLPFGELIRRSLEETGRYVVGVTGDQKTASVYAREFKPVLAFLDTSLAESDLLKIGVLLRQTNPKIIFVVISEAGWHSALEELFPRDFLSKPFYMPDLLKMMEKFIPASSTMEPSAPEETSKNDFPWLSDNTRAAQHLTRLTLESSAQAALITRGDQLWAYAGQLPQPAANELAETLSRYWDHQEENDLVRFVRLVSTNAEHMLYATRLAEGMVLALVFDAETPFSTIRTQASQLVHSLSISPSEEPLDEDLAEEGLDLNSLSDILSDIPAPNPPTNLLNNSGYEFGTSVSETRNGTAPAIPVPPARSADVRREYSLPVQFRPLVDTEKSGISSSAVKDVPQVGISSNRASKMSPAPESIQETRPNSIAAGAHKIVLEPISPAVYNLDYACVLIPRFPQHHITGDLLDRLGEWVADLCISYFWRLNYISVRPDYMQWIVNVPPVTAPAHLMRILRQHTSARIFAEFPRFKRENPSGEFWAPGYLIMSGSQPPPAQLIKDFISQTRQRQGIPPQPNQ
jgi:REP element-mobilizing transposase RayT/DNA-binding response OmpR family regulator